MFIYIINLEATNVNINIKPLCTLIYILIYNLLDPNKVGSSS